MDPSFGKQRHHDLPIPQSLGFGHRSSHGQDYACPKIRRRADRQHVSWEEEEEEEEEEKEEEEEEEEGV